MKSKIEKIEIRLVKDMDTKRDIQNIYQCLIELANKTNELIEAHNSQSQPEEKGRIGCEYSDCYKCPKCNDELLVTCLHPLELLCTRCREYVETVDIYNPVTDTTYRLRKKQGVTKSILRDTEELKQELFTFFLWFRWNGEKYMNKSIEKMIKVYLEERELGDVLGKIEKQNKLKRG